MTLALRETEYKYPFHYVTESLSGRFERIAMTVYRDLAQSYRTTPVLSRHHIFCDEDTGILDALSDFVYEVHYTTVAESEVREKPIDKWDDSDWEDVDEEYATNLVSFQLWLLDDMEVIWSRQGLTFIDEHSMMSEKPKMENACLQEVW